VAIISYESRRRLLLQARALRPATHPSCFKQELVERLLAAIEDINKQPAIHTWSYKLESAA
jgi:hypothetical protein